MTKKVKVETNPEELKKRRDAEDAYAMQRARRAMHAREEEEKARITSEKLELFNQSEIDPGTRKEPENWLDFEIADRYEIAEQIGSHPAQESLVLPPNTSALTQTAFNDLKLAIDPQNIADVLVKFFDDFLQQDEQKRIELTQILMAAYKKLLLLFPESESKNYYSAVARIVGKIGVGSIIEEIFTEDYGSVAEQEKIIGIRNLLKGIPSQYRNLNPGKHHVRKRDHFSVKTYDPDTKVWKTNTVPTKSASSASSTSSASLTSSTSSNRSSSPDTPNTSKQHTSSGRVVKKVAKLSADTFGPATMSYASREVGGVVDETSVRRTTISPKNPDIGRNGPKLEVNGRKIDVVDPDKIPNVNPKPKPQGPKQ